jgi:hypothetical protein
VESGLAFQLVDDLLDMPLTILPENHYWTLYHCWYILEFSETR